MNNQRRRPSPTLIYFILSGASTLADATMFTVLMVYFVKAVGLNPFQLVFVGTVLEATCFLLEVPTGVVADTYSRRLSVVIGMFFLGAAFVLVGAVSLFAYVLLGQVISGVGYTFLSGATDAWLADEVGEANVGRIYLRSGQVNRVLGLLGTGLSVGLASLNLHWPILVGGAMYLALGVFLALAMPEHGFKPVPREARDPNPFHAMRRTFQEGARVMRGRPILLTLLAVQVVAGAASEGVDRLSDAHLLANFTFPALAALEPVVWFGIMGASMSLVSLIATEIFRRRLEAVSQNPVVTAKVLLVLNTLAVIGVLAFALAGSFPMAFAILLARAVVGSMIGPLYNTWVIQHINPKVRATVLSMISQSNALGQIAGGPVVGAIGTVFSLRAALATAGLLLSPASLLYARALKNGEVGGPQPEIEATAAEP